MTTITLNLIRIIAFINFIFLGILVNAHETDHEVMANAENELIKSAAHDALLKQMIKEQLENEGAIFEPHVVDRGETWESLARISGIDELDLKSLNGGVKNLYAGLEITLVSFPKWSINYERKILAMYPLIISEAESYMKAKEWKKATKLYTRIIECSECLTARYMRGVAYYNNGKFKEAAKDFSWVAGNDRFKLYDDAFDLSQQANNAWEQKKAERAEFWGNLAGAVLQTGLQVASNIVAAKQMESYGSTYSQITSPTTTGMTGSLAAQMEQPGFFENVHNNIMNLSIQQVQEQQQREYMYMRESYLRMGKDLTWDEFLSIQSQAYAMMQAEESGKSVVDNNDSQTKNYGAGTYATYGDKTCHLCRGTGICQTCNGKGIARDNMFGTGKHYDCPNCYLENGIRTGKCSGCGGKGTRYGKL